MNRKCLEITDSYSDLVNPTTKMVCVPCVAVPLLLIIWRFLIQPLLMKWWQFRGKIDDTKKGEESPELVKDCKNGVCTLSWKKNAKQEETNPKKAD